MGLIVKKSKGNYIISDSFIIDYLNDFNFKMNGDFK